MDGLASFPSSCKLAFSSSLHYYLLIIILTTIFAFQLDTGLLSDCLPEVTRMARKFTHISTLLQYLHLSLTCMCEAWEDILMQMDLRLTKFVQVSSRGLQSKFFCVRSVRVQQMSYFPSLQEKNTSTQVQDEFLELLLWGQSRWEKWKLVLLVFATYHIAIFAVSCRWWQNILG